MLRPTARRVATALAACQLLVATAVGCSDGGSGGGNRESSVDEFCTALQEFRSEVDAADSTDLAAYIRALKAAAADVDEVGIPDDMPPAAERGFDLTIARIQDLADDATQDDVARLGDVSDEEQQQLDALEGYIDGACPDLTP